MPALLPARATPPSYSQGLARFMGLSANPQMWRGLQFAFAPSLGAVFPQDASGHGHAGTFNVLGLADYRVGQDVRFPGYALRSVGGNGSSERVDFGASPALNLLNDLTVVSRVRYVGTTVTNISLILTRSEGSSTLTPPEKGWGLLIRRISGTLRFQWNISGVDGAWNVLFNSGSENDDALHSVVGRTQGDNHSLWVDGIEVDTANIVIGERSLPSATLRMFTDNGLFIGSNIDVESTYLYDRALSDAEISDHHTLHLPPFQRRRRTIRKGVEGRIMSSLVGAGGLAGMGGIAGQGGGLAA